jgi:hypothetical protein
MGGMGGSSVSSAVSSGIEGGSIDGGSSATSSLIEGGAIGGSSGEASLDELSSPVAEGTGGKSNAGEGAGGVRGGKFSLASSS